jgi:hypothetical protein
MDLALLELNLLLQPKAKVQGLDTHQEQVSKRVLTMGFSLGVVLCKSHLLNRLADQPLWAVGLAALKLQHLDLTPRRLMKALRVETIEVLLTDLHLLRWTHSLKFLVDPDFPSKPPPWNLSTRTQEADLLPSPRQNKCTQWLSIDPNHTLLLCPSTTTRKAT